jgi:hypothetical protein
VVDPVLIVYCLPRLHMVGPVLIVYCLPKLHVQDLPRVAKEDNTQ